MTLNLIKQSHIALQHTLRHKETDLLHVRLEVVNGFIQHRVRALDDVGAVLAVVYGLCVMPHAAAFSH